jgi:hypothetical protein
VYQSIDDPTEETAASQKRTFVLWPYLVSLIALSIVGAVIFLNLPAQEDPTTSDEDVLIAISAYRKAIAEPDPALRRARLNDYLLTIESGSHEAAIIAQINVLDNYEFADWKIVQDQVYSRDMTKEEKLAALDIYESKWGGTLLGARDEDIISLREEILGLTSADSLPDRRFDDDESPISEDIPDDVLAGAPKPKVIYTPPPEPDDEDEYDTPPDSDEAESTPLRVRRNGRLTYPRAAMRRNIPALVTLKLDIDARGRVTTAELVSVEAERYEDDFVKAAERAAMRSRYYPKIEKGEPVAVSGIVKRFRFEP